MTIQAIDAGTILLLLLKRVQKAVPHNEYAREVGARVVAGVVHAMVARGVHQQLDRAPELGHQLAVDKELEHGVDPPCAAHTPPAAR